MSCANHIVRSHATIIICRGGEPTDDCLLRVCKDGRCDYELESETNVEYYLNEEGDRCSADAGEFNEPDAFESAIECCEVAEDE